MRYHAAGSWTGQGSKVENVTVYLPDTEGDTISGNNLPPNARWRVMSDVKVVMDTIPMSLGKNPTGAMRDPYRLFDSNGNIFGAVLQDSGLQGVDARRLVYKKYRQNFGVQDIEFRDAWMQFEADCFARRFNEESPIAQDCFFTPVKIVFVHKCKHCWPLSGSTGYIAGRCHQACRWFTLQRGVLFDRCVTVAIACTHCSIRNTAFSSFLSHCCASREPTPMIY